MASYESQPENLIDAEAEKEFGRRILRNALWHRANEGLDPLYVYRLRATGLLHDVTPSSLPGILPEILRNPESTSGVTGPAGPLIFARVDEHIEVIDVFGLLFQNGGDIRSAALDYLLGAATSPGPWLTSRTLKLLGDRSDDVRADESGRWQVAAVDVVPVLRQDFLGHLAGLRQSLAARYEDGLNDYLSRVIRPEFDALAQLRAPLWCATEQTTELRAWVEECATLASLPESLTLYLNRCGYVPLCSAFGADSVARAWLANHPGAEVRWDELRAWAQAIGAPSARYHALIIALYFPSARPRDSMKPFWDEALRMIAPCKTEDPSADGGARWELYSDLAVHFAHHVEALHPAQAGERVACYAWWLADMVVRALGTTEQQAFESRHRIITPEAELSVARWTIARSPVTPSPLWYTTLCVRSVWAVSLFAQLARAGRLVPEASLTDEERESFAHALNAYIIASPLGTPSKRTPMVFAFQENEQLGDLFGRHDLLPVGAAEPLRESYGFRQTVFAGAELRDRLERLLELPEHEQYWLLLLLKECVLSATAFDDDISGWLSDSANVVEAIHKLSRMPIGLLVAILAEFQQRAHSELSIRIPHLLTYAVEQSEDAERVRFLHAHAMHMSINVGIVSPIQRLLASKWRGVLVEDTASWRDSLIAIANLSEPWVAARTRATCAAVSRIVGPGITNRSVPGAGVQVEQ